MAAGSFNFNLIIPIVVHGDFVTFDGSPGTDLGFFSRPCPGATRRNFICVAPNTTEDIGPVNIAMLKSDDHFIIDTVPGLPQVSMAAGFSGHGFKFASVVGEILGDLAINGKTNHNIDLLRLNRF